MRVGDFPILTKEQEQVASSDLLVVSHGRLVIKMASRYARYGVDIDDLIQEGNIGLMIAAEKFDRSVGVRFSTYAQWWVRASMKTMIMRTRNVVKPETSAKARSLYFKNMPPLDVALDKPMGESGDTLVDILESPDLRPDEIVERGMDAERLSASLRRAIDTLSPREADIIRRRFLGEAKEGLESVGASHGISKERVRQIEAKAIEKLRKRMVA